MRLLWVRYRTEAERCGQDEGGFPSGLATLVQLIWSHNLVRQGSLIVSIHTFRKQVSDTSCILNTSYGRKLQSDSRFILIYLTKTTVGNILSSRI